MMDMIRNVDNSFFIILGSILLILVSKNLIKLKPGFERGDFAFGFDLFVTSIIIIGAEIIKVNNSNTIGSVSEMAHRVSQLFVIFIVYAALLFALILIVRHIGWTNYGYASRDKKLSYAWGIWIPNILGIVALLYTLEVVNTSEEINYAPYIYSVIVIASIGLISKFIANFKTNRDF